MLTPLKSYTQLAEVWRELLQRAQSSQWITNEKWSKGHVQRWWGECDRGFTLMTVNIEETGRTHHSKVYVKLSARLSTTRSKSSQTVTLVKSFKASQENKGLCLVVLCVYTAYECKPSEVL